MKQRDREAARLEHDYIHRLQQLLATRNLSEQMDILQQVRQEIEQRLSDGEPVTLVQMAAALQALGSPEAQAVERVAMAAARAAAREDAPPPVIDYPTAQVAAAPPAAEAIPLLNKIWWGVLVSTVGLFIPVIGLDFCAIAGSVIVAMSILKSRGRVNEELRVVGELEWAVAGILLAMSAFTAAALVVPLLSAVNLLLLVGLLICSLFSYWILMTTLARWVKVLGREDVSRRIRTRRNINLLAIVPASLVLAIALGMTFGDEWYVGYAMLPIYWIVGYLFSLEPISWTIAAFRDTGPA